MVMLLLTSFINGVVTVIVFCLLDNVVFIVFKLPSTYDFKGYADKSIVILFDTSFFKGVIVVIVF